MFFLCNFASKESGICFAFIKHGAPILPVYQWKMELIPLISADPARLNLIYTKDVGLVEKWDSCLWKKTSMCASYPPLIWKSTQVLSWMREAENIHLLTGQCLNKKSGTLRGKTKPLFIFCGIEMPFVRTGYLSNWCPVAKEQKIRARSS